MQIKLASYNIQYGVGKDHRLDLNRIAAELGHADLIALQEVEVGNPLRGMRDQPEELANILGHQHCVYGPGVDVYLDPSLTGGRPGLRQKFGNMILSRWPILSVVTHALPKVALRDLLHLQCMLIETVIGTPAGPLRFCCTHLSHMSPMTRMPQVHALREIMLDALHRGAPLGGVDDDMFLAETFPDWPNGGIIMGDMNFTPDAPEYAFLIGDLSPILGTRVQRAGGLYDAWQLAGHAESEGNTFVRPNRPARRFDYCFVTPEYSTAIRSMSVDDAAVGSDHQPIFVELDLA